MNLFDKKAYVEKLLEQDTLISPQLLTKLEKDEFVEVDAGRSILQEKNISPSVKIEKKVGPLSKPGIKVLFSYSEKSHKRDCQDFIDYFNERYKHLQGLLRQRAELQNLVSVSSLPKQPSNTTYSLIGMVQEVTLTKNGNMMISLEDPTGIVRVIASQTKKDAFGMAQDLVHDEVIGVNGVSRGGFFVANSITHPDLPNSELKKSPYPGWAVFLSDIHVGSSQFLGEYFDRFLQWIQGKSGSEEQREIARNVRYMFIAGDVVDGVGIYPAQENELRIPDIFDQYKECARLLSSIPKHIKIIICPGNHDATRISEPQPPFSDTFAKPLVDLPNILPLSNPCLVSIDATDEFSGITVLMYHGYSFDYYVANVDSIRRNGGYDRPDLIMRFLLERRHLAPAHTSTLYIPDARQDPLFIRTPPDIFVTGHVHRTAASHYRDTTLISGSCWQDMTPFQERMGHRPQPARVPVIDLQTRNVKILKFGKD